MIELYISTKVDSHSKLKNRIESSDIALRVIEGNNIKKAILIKGSKTHEGVKAINGFLDEFESFMWNWHAPKFDNHDVL